MHFFICPHKFDGDIYINSCCWAESKNIPCTQKWLFSTNCYHPQCMLPRKWHSGHRHRVTLEINITHTHTISTIPIFSSSLKFLNRHRFLSNSLFCIYFFLLTRFFSLIVQFVCIFFCNLLVLFFSFCLFPLFFPHPFFLTHLIFLILLLLNLCTNSITLLEQTNSLVKHLSLDHLHRAINPPPPPFTRMKDKHCFFLLCKGLLTFVPHILSLNQSTNTCSYRIRL